MIIIRVIGISGMPGSGKSIVSDMACKKGAIIVSMGDIIREEAEKRGETTGETAVNLRKEHGQYIVSELTIEKIKKLQNEGFEKIVVEENSIINELRNMGYGWVDWTAGDGDGGSVPNATVAWSNFTSQIIILICKNII